MWLPALLVHTLLHAPPPQVLRLTGGVERLFSGWADDGAAQRFKRRLDQYLAIWCCVNAHPGHVWCVRCNKQFHGCGTDVDA